MKSKEEINLEMYRLTVIHQEITNTALKTNLTEPLNELIKRAENVRTALKALQFVTDIQTKKIEI